MSNNQEKQAGYKDHVVTYTDLNDMTLKEMYEYAKKFKVPYYSKMNKKELALAIVRRQEEEKGYYQADGILEILDQQDFGFLHPINYSASSEDIYISGSQIRRFDLRTGDRVVGIARPPKKNERHNGLLQVSEINGRDPNHAKDRPHFPALTALYPETLLKLESQPKRVSTRLIDLLTPIGLGQRGLIVAPPKAGKTTIIKEIANGISQNHPDVDLMVLLIDERPEEVTDIERSVNGEVVASTFDQRPDHHIQVAELVLERARRLVEDKRDVVILMDSITRLARAYNLVEAPSGRTLSGGIDPAALYRPKRFFGSARNIEEGGSLTIIATALVETGSRMDDVIYEEFKGTGNMELQLSRALANRRVFPAIDIPNSSTRRDDLLLDQADLDRTWTLRRWIGENPLDHTEDLVRLIVKTQNNQQFLAEIEKALQKKK